MIIVSKFHDYYDSAMSYGIDKTLRFIRQLEETDKLLEMPESLTEMLKGLSDVYDFWNKNTHDFSARPFIVVLCGKIHLGYHCSNLKDSEYKNRYCFPIVPDIYVYDLLSLEKVIERYNKDLFKTFYEKSKYSYLSRTSFKHDGLEKKFKEFKDKKIGIGIHLDEEAPILYIGYKNRDFVYIKNLVLRKLQFYKKMNAFQVFQDISVFIGGVVSKTFPPTVELGEKDRIEKSGFDKWSFRKMGKNSK